MFFCSASRRGPGPFGSCRASNELMPQVTDTATTHGSVETTKLTTFFMAGSSVRVLRSTRGRAQPSCDYRRDTTFWHKYATTVKRILLLCVDEGRLLIPLTGRTRLPSRWRNCGWRRGAGSAAGGPRNGSNAAIRRNGLKVIF